MTLLRKIGIVTFLLIAAACIFGIVELSRYEPVQDLILYGFIALISLGLAFLLFAWPKRCKKCKKWFAMVQGNNDLIGRSSYTKREVTGETKSARTDAVIEKHYSDVAYNKDIVMLNWYCKYCGCKKSRKTTHTYKS